MEKVTTHLDGRQLTYEDIRARKREVLSQIHEQQQVMRQCVGELADDFTNTGNLMSAKGIRKVSGWIGGAFYAYRIIRGLSRMTHLLRRH